MAMSRTRKIVLIVSGLLVALVLVFIVGIALIFAALRGSGPSVKDNSVLALRIGGSLPDYVPEDPMRRLLGGSDESLTNLLMQIKKAKVDKRIGAVILEIHPSSAGWAKADEIREAIADYRTSGKPIYAYME